MQVPGQGKGLVNKVTGVTPDMVRTGLRLSLCSMPSSYAGDAILPGKSAPGVD